MSNSLMISKEILKMITQVDWKNIRGPPQGVFLAPRLFLQWDVQLLLCDYDS